jgi:DNA-binding NarL/FixJ family response regulator
MPDVHIVVVASNSLNRSGIEALIAKSGAALKVTASFGDLPAADRFMKENRVDIVIIDDSLPHTMDIGKSIGNCWLSILVWEC